MSPDEIIAKLREQRRYRRGRPPGSNKVNLHRLALEVFDLEHELGQRRGARAKAVREVAHRHALPGGAETLRRFVHRHRRLREFATALRSIRALLAEQERAAVAPLRDLRSALEAAPADLMSLTAEP